MEGSPRPGCALPVVGTILLILACAGLPYAYAILDYGYVQGTMRAVQDTGVFAARVLAGGLVVSVLAAAGYAVIIGVGIYTRWASPEARRASTEVALARAQHMELPDGLSTYNVQHHYRGAREAIPVELREPQPQVIEAEVSAPQLPAPHETFSYGQSRIKQLVERGDIAVGSDQLLAGYDAERRPRYIKASDLGLGIIVGQSAKGKSSLAGLLIAQAALADWTIIICDPVYHRDERSLLKDFLAGLTGAIYRQAVRPEEIAAAVGLAMKIAQRRLDGESSEGRVLLVIDEFSSVAGRKMLDSEALENLFLTATKAAAVGVHTLLIAHDLSGSWFGGQSARRGRDQATHRLICNMSPAAAAPILPSPAYAQQVAVLPVGQALFFDGWQEPALVSFPRLAPADLAWAAQGRAPRPYAPWQPAQPQRLTTTEELPQSKPSAPPEPPRLVPPTTQLGEPPLAELIIEVLAAAPAGLDAEAIIQRLGAPTSSVKNRLSKLRGEGVISARPGKGGAFTYTLVQRPQTA